MNIFKTVINLLVINAVVAGLALSSDAENVIGNNKQRDFFATHLLSPRGMNVINIENSRYKSLSDYYGYVSKDRSTMVNNHLPADISLLLGNSHIETFVRYAYYWRGLPVKPAIIIAGGVGRGTPGLIKKIRKFYGDNEVFRSLGEKIDSLSEAEIIAEVLLIEGVDKQAIRYLEKDSTNTAENFDNSLILLKKLSQDIGREKPHLEIITHAPLVFRVHMTALKKLSGLVDKDWKVTSRSHVGSSFADLTYDEKVDMLGYSLGYPQSFRPEEQLNRLSEVERIENYGNGKAIQGLEPDVAPIDWDNEQFSPAKINDLREKIFADLMKERQNEEERSQALSLSVYLESGSLTLSEELLGNIFQQESVVDLFLMNRVVAELYFSPHLFDSSYFMKKFNIDSEKLKNIYSLIRDNEQLQLLFRKYSPHSNYFMIINRELTNPVIKELAEGKFVFPRKMELHVGHRCPGNCKFCYSYKLRKELAEDSGRKVQSMPMYMEELNGAAPLTLKEYKKIIRDFKDNSVDDNPILVISGGAEPATFPDLSELIDYAVSLGISVELYTSGVGLLRGKNKEEAMKKLLKCSFIRFSLNAATPETYRKQMDLRSFEHVKAVIKSLTDMKRKIDSETSLRANFVINRDNYLEILPYVDLACDLGLDQAVLRTPYTGTTELLNRYEQIAVKSALQQVLKNTANQKYGDLQVQMPGNFVLEGFHPKDFGVEQFDWRTAFFSPTITPFGNVVPRCTVANPGYYSDKYSIGSVAAKHGTDLLRSLKKFYAKKEHFTDNIDLFDSSTLSLELFLRFLDREAEKGITVLDLPLKARLNGKTVRGDILTDRRIRNPLKQSA